jgi:hypothetical protein
VLIYLNVIFNYRLFLHDLPTPLWKRGFQWLMVMKNVGRFSPALLVSLVACAISMPLCSALSGVKWDRTIGGGCITFSWSKLFPAVRLAICLSVGVYLTALAVEMGGYRFDHYFIFAIPFYQSVVMRFALDVLGSQARVRWTLGNAVIACIAYGSFGVTQPDYRSAAASMRSWRRPGIETAALVDEVLDDCGIGRYLSIGFVGAQVYAFSRHSPLGPLFVQWQPWLRYPLFRTTLWQNVKNAQVVAVNVNEWGVLGNLEQATRRELSQNFQEQPWSCYRGKRQPVHPFRLFYRKR